MYSNTIKKNITDKIIFAFRKNNTNLRERTVFNREKTLCTLPNLIDSAPAYVFSVFLEISRWDSAAGSARLHTAYRRISPGHCECVHVIQKSTCSFCGGRIAPSSLTSLEEAPRERERQAAAAEIRRDSPRRSRKRRTCVVVFVIHSVVFPESIRGSR